VKNSLHFIRILESLKTKPGDLIVSFDVVSLFTKVPVEESLTLLSQHFNKYILALYKHVLTSTYFCVDGQFYEQTDGIAMGSPLSPVIAKFYMEDFELKAIKQATNKPACWYRYVDYTFVIWPHGKEELTDFLNHLNGIHNNIQFTMEIKMKDTSHFWILTYTGRRTAPSDTEYIENPPLLTSTYTKIPSPSSQQVLSPLIPGT